MKANYCHKALAYLLLLVAIFSTYSCRTGFTTSAGHKLQTIQILPDQHNSTKANAPIASVCNRLEMPLEATPLRVQISNNKHLRKRADNKQQEIIAATINHKSPQKEDKQQEVISEKKAPRNAWILPMMVRLLMYLFIIFLVTLSIGQLWLLHMVIIIIPQLIAAYIAYQKFIHLIREDSAAKMNENGLFKLKIITRTVWTAFYLLAIMLLISALASIESGGPGWVMIILTIEICTALLLLLTTLALKTIYLIKR